MNPKEFNWTDDQFVTVVNPTEKPFKFMAHSKEYEVGPGQTVRMAGFIAWLYVYGLACQLSQKEGTFDRWNEEGFRQKYFERLVISTDDAVQQVVVEPGIEEVTDPVADETESEESEQPTEEPKRGRGRRKAA